MGIILDVIVVAIIALSVYSCYRKGLVNLAVGLIAVVASVILALILYRPVSNLLIEKTNIDESIEKVIIEKVIGDVPEGAQVRFESAGLINYIEDFVDGESAEDSSQFAYDTASTLAVKLVNTIVIIAIFIIARILLIMLTFITDIITSLPILSQLDSVGGILYGLVKALLIIYVVLAIAFFVANIAGVTQISDTIASSFVTKLFYEHNLLLTILF